MAEFTQHSTLDTLQILLEDRLTGTLTDLTKEVYSFVSSPGCDDSRFMLHIGTSATSVQYVAMPSQQKERPAFNLQGQPVSDSFKGIIIKNGKMNINR